MHERDAGADQLPSEAYRFLVDAVADYAIYMLDPGGRVISWNTGAERIKGYARDEILGQHFSRFFTEPDRAAGRPQQAIEAALGSGHHHDEGWRLRKDGSRFWALTVLEVVHDDDGRLVGLAKITRDMSQQRALQQALVDSERAFRLLVEGVTDYAIYMLDPHGRINSWNTGAERIKGYVGDEVIGAHFSMFYTPEDRDAGHPQRNLRLALEQGRYEAEGWRVRKDGRRFWANVVIDPIRAPGGGHVGFAKVTRDITERREAQQRLDEVREQLQQAQKLEAIGQLTGGVAHDFNNLLTIIRGAADLAGRFDCDERVRRQIDVIASAAEQGAAITRQLLSFARRQPLHTAPVSPAELVRRILPLLRQPLRRGITLGSEIADDLPEIEIDAHQLELALLNLVINARDAIRGDGEVRIDVRRLRLDGGFDGLVGEFIAFAVRDTGSGIPPELRARVFEPFFTTKQFGKGTGLGLSQAYGFARQSGGTVRIDSEPGAGTTVAILLPAVPPRDRGRDPAPAPPASPARHVLLVEDDTDLAAIAAAMLEMMGFEVTTAHGADEAQRAMAAMPRIDLLFSDIVMPGGMNGIELANHARRRLPELPILLTSGFSTMRDDGPAHYPILDKPYTYERLERALRDAVGTAVD
ncbi:hybrid sensor histidine kinase/response regulator [Coralloluteibacterium stylophorae]|uniref:histidine kinase n=1 Tax=Coralloluteibacterium stylophorae TaxID=1776034 RepID=A0A8J7VSX0_9GAMM|nr:PAS domain-containing sensor histidine kinase [Coralloluteibacterium stylophorae]MBS7455554.1 PAS domain S-box protein [Coralloluteibacterium stylophorae]